MQVVRVDANGTDGVKGNNKKGKGDKDEADNDEVNKTNEARNYLNRLYVFVNFIQNLKHVIILLLSYFILFLIDLRFLLLFST